MQKDIRRELNKIDDGSAKTVGRKIGRELEQGVGQGATGAANQVKSRLSEQLGTQVGTVVGRGIGKGIKLSMVGIGAIAGAAVGGVGLALTKGFDRLKSIDQAKFKLQALGNDAATTAKIMDNALASVKGTAFGLQDAATAAASAVAAGIKPGEDLTKYLSEVGDAAAVAGVNFTDMGSIFNKIQTSNKAYTDDLNQLADKGLPIFKWLQEEYGVTGDKLTDMVQKGEVDAAHFQEAIDKNIGGAAQKMGQSFDGAVDNMEASVARLGANFITAILGGDPANALDGPTQAITLLTDKFDTLGVWVNDHRAEIHQFFSDMAETAKTAGTAVKSIGEFLVQHEGLLEAAAAAWLGWKAISATASVLGAVKGIATTLGGLGGAAEVGASGMLSAFAPLASNPVFLALTGGLAFGAGIGPLLNAGPDAANQKRWDDFNQQQRDNAAKNRVPAIIGPTSPVQGPGVRPSGPQLPVSPPGTSGTYDPKNPLLLPYGRAGGGKIFGPGTGTSDSILARLSDGEFVVNADATRKNMPLLEIINSGKIPGFSGGGNTGGSLTPNASQLQSLISQVFPEITNIGGWRPPDGFNEHSSGQALDLMIPNANTPEGKALGDRVNQWLLQNADALGIQYDLWQQAQWNPDGTSSGMENRGGATANHRDHVHVRVKPGAATGASLAQDYADSIDAGAKSKVDELKQNGSGSSGGFGGEQLGQSIFGGLMQSLGFDGSVFSDFTQWPNFKSGVALANFGGSLLQGAMGQDPSTGGGFGIPGLSGVSSLLSPLTPNAVGGSDHAGSGALPGPSIVNNGVIGMDPRALTQRVDAHQNQAYRRSGLQAVRPGG